MSPRLRSGDGGAKKFNSLNEDYITQNLQLVRILRPVRPLLELLIGATFLIVLWRGDTRVLTARSRSAISSCSTPTMACWYGR